MSPEGVSQGEIAAAIRNSVYQTSVRPRHDSHAQSEDKTLAPGRARRDVQLLPITGAEKPGNPVATGRLPRPAAHIWKRFSESRPPAPQL
jgi:hypothetical protein